MRRTRPCARDFLRDNALKTRINTKRNVGASSAGRDPCPREPLTGSDDSAGTPFNPASLGRLAILLRAVPVTAAQRQHRFLQRDYSRSEIISDGAVHIVGLVASLIGLTVLVMLTARWRGLIEVSAVIIYGIALVTMLGFSLAYNMIPVSPLKWLMRRFDHCGIYLLIAGTYTPLLTQVSDPWTAYALASTVWIGAAAGIVMALGFPGRADRFKVGAYLGLAWVAVVAIKPLMASLSGTTILLLVAGGMLYTLGVVFYRWNSLRYQNVIWHIFVVAAATCHFAAIATAMATT